MKPRLLDLFCGAGGAAMGYARAGFEVVGVDIKSQPHYPFEFHQADAMTYPLDGFDAIHASPPCQEYSSAIRHLVTADYGKLLDATRDRLTGHTHVIENVPGAPIPTQPALWGSPGVRLCGTAFGLTVETPGGLREVRRHRLFESSVTLLASPACRHRLPAINPYRTKSRQRDGLEHGSAKAFIKAMGINWPVLDKQGLEAIPPAYTEWIGRQLIESLAVAA